MSYRSKRAKKWRRARPSRESILAQMERQKRTWFHWKAGDPVPANMHFRGPGSVVIEAP